MYRVFLFVLFILFSCTGLSSFHSDDIPVEEIDFGRIENVETVNILDYYQSSHYLQLKVPSGVAFYHASKIMYGNDKYFIADLEYEQALFVFDKNGEYLYHIESGGAGPGEIPDIEDIAYNHDSKTILFLGSSGRRLYEFSESGVFIRDIRLSIDKFFNFIAYGGENKLWLYTLPPPADKVPQEGFKLLHVVDLESLEVENSFLTIPDGLVAQVSGHKELTMQNNEIVFSMAFSNTVFRFSNYGSRASKLISLAKTDNMFGLPSLEDFLTRLAQDNSLTLVDNYVSGQSADLMLILKSGSFMKWGILDKGSQKFKLVDTLIDDNLGLPLIPFIDAHRGKIFKMLDSEFLEGVFLEENNKFIVDKLVNLMPGLLGEDEKLILCVYE
jgi:hypothetical protein